jgi:hypothetical protein
MGATNMVVLVVMSKAPEKDVTASHQRTERVAA